MAGMSETESAAVLLEYEQLLAQKDALETEIAAIAEELTSGSPPAGITGALVDAEGFPRADIDVYRVRHQRHAFACKQNDHRAVMKRIEQILPQLFEARSMASTSAAPKPTTGEPPSPVVMPVKDSAVVTRSSEQALAREREKKPFARVDSVQDDSPAASADLRANDLVLAFGSADASNHRNLEAIKEIVLRNVGSPIRVVVRRSLAVAMRQGGQDTTEELLELSLTPQSWRGPGVLGCLLVPISDPIARAEGA